MIYICSIFDISSNIDYIFDNFHRNYIQISSVIYCSAHDLSIATSLCQSALSVLVEWCENNRLTINTQKTKIMAICRNNRAKLDWKTESS